MGHAVFNERPQGRRQDLNKTETIQSFLHKPERSIAAAGLLERDGSFDFAVSRAYYAMFYCAEALLFSKGLTSSKHGGVIALFGREFVKAGLLDAKYHRFLNDAFKERLKGDYETALETTVAKCGEVIRNARLFLDATATFLQLK